MSLRVVSVEGHRHWRTDSRKITLLEVGSDALAEAIGAPLARDIERGFQIVMVMRYVGGS